MNTAHVPTAGMFGTGDGEVVRQLNSFLCEEISAEVAYHLTAERLAGDRDAAAFVGVLRRIEEEHELAAQSLREQIQEVGGEALDACGSLGAWADATRCLKGLFGKGAHDGSALECLRLAEENNLAHYNSGLTGVDADSAQLLKNLLIPTQCRHIRVLSELIGA